MQASKALLAALALGITGLAQAADEVVVYSSRIDELIKPVFDAYTSKTGVKVKFITDKEAPLMARIKAEGANTPADLLLTRGRRQPLAGRADGPAATVQVGHHRTEHSLAVSFQHR